VAMDLLRGFLLKLGLLCSVLRLLGRCWTAERRQRHGLQSSADCALCSQESETISHLLVQCVFSREIWFKVFRRFEWQQLCPAQDDCLAPWWLRSRQLIPKGQRKAFDSMVVLICWAVWLQRNDLTGKWLRL
jgi:hypothetical protein